MHAPPSPDVSRRSKVTPTDVPYQRFISKESLPANTQPSLLMVTIISSTNKVILIILHCYSKLNEAREKSTGGKCHSRRNELVENSRPNSVQGIMTRLIDFPDGHTLIGLFFKHAFLFWSIYFLWKLNLNQWKSTENDWFKFRVESWKVFFDWFSQVIYDI